VKEINRYPVENSDAVLIHVKEEDGEEYVWIAMCPAERFVPEEASECFVVAMEDDGFAGLKQLKDALEKCAAGCRGAVT